MEFDDFDAIAEQVMFPHMDADVLPGDTEDIEDTEENHEEWRQFNVDPESRDWANGWGRCAEVDGNALASAGFGTDEDYGDYGGDDF
jgi:hypothetical protein